MQRKIWLMATAFAGIAALGCGDDGGGGKVSGASRVSDLTESERKTLCEEFATKFKKMDSALIKIECTEDGLAAELDEAGSCEQVRSECIASATPDTEFDVSCNDAPEEMTGGEDCDATVAQFHACVDALVSMSETLANDYTCEESDVEEPDLPTACTDLQDACPEAVNFME